MDIDEISNRSETGPSDAQGGKLKGEAKKAAHDAKAALAREMDEAKTRAAGAARQIKDGARHAGDRVATLLSEQTERQKADVADSLRAVAQTMRDAAQDQPEGMGARLVDEAAWRLEDVSSRLDDRSVAEMAQDVADFGRRNPGMFLAGCLAAGFAAGRFLTSGPTDSRSGAYREGAERDSYGYADRDAYGEGASRGRAGYGEGRPGPGAGPGEGSARNASATAADRSGAWASGGVDAAKDGGTQDGGTDDVNVAHAYEGVSPDTRTGTGFPADAGEDERAPFGAGPASEGVAPEGSPARGGGRDGGF